MGAVEGANLQQTSVGDQTGSRANVDAGLERIRVRAEIGTTLQNRDGNPAEGAGAEVVHSEGELILRCQITSVDVDTDRRDPVVGADVDVGSAKHGGGRRGAGPCSQAECQGVGLGVHVLVVLRPNRQRSDVNRRVVADLGQRRNPVGQRGLRPGDSDSAAGEALGLSD